MEAVTSVPTTETWEVFGTRLRYWRRRAGLTQAQLGRRLGYHFSQISRLEAGRRSAPMDLVGRADLLLGAGGELTAIRMAITGETPSYEPEPAASAFAMTGWLPFSWLFEDPVAWDGMPPPLTGAWPTGLPARGRPCPLHGNDGCAVPTPDDAIRAYLDARSHSGQVSRIGVDLIHALAAMLVMYERTSEELVSDDVLPPVEQLLRTIVRWGSGTRGTTARALLRLAANYARFAGWLRVSRGQRGLGMTWFNYSVQWATTAGDVGSLALVLCDMSFTARIERDGAAAGTYARAIAAGDPGRRWLAALAGLYEAPALAMEGEVGRCERRIAQVGARLARFDGRDRTEAPWLLGGEGQARVSSSTSGSLRDIAARTGDPRVARRAIAAAHDSLAHLPVWMNSSRVLLTLRLADSYACSGDLDAAMTTVMPTLAEATTTVHTWIDEELRGFCERVLSTWAGSPEARELDERLYETRWSRQ